VVILTHKGVKQLNISKIKIKVRITNMNIELHVTVCLDAFHKALEFFKVTNQAVIHTAHLTNRR
jgi:hypothetical protein